MVTPSVRPFSLPRDATRILELAARSMFDLFAGASEGMLLVDREARVVWINDPYRRYLPALGFAREEDFVGHPVSSVVQNTQMHQVLKTGQPILIDLLSNRAGTFVVSRIPLRDEAGEVIGALGIVLFDQPTTTLQPLIAKFARLQQELDDARRELAAKDATSPRHARQSRYTFASFIGSSPAAVEVKRQARRAAQSASPVLLLGETGTGKELLAHGIHAASKRAGGPFVSINIAAVPDTLLEAEFFGTAPGAYTGADRKGREGKFKLADGGTLFLDEIGDMPLGVQAKLLRALQEGEIEPLGSNRLLPFDARIVAATSRDLAALVHEGRFREDLYYRLNVLPIRVPPLRERRSDIPALIEVLGEDMAQRGTPPPELTEGALALLAAQAWRGNIRELRNVLEQAALRSDADRLDAAQMEAVLRQSGVAQVAPALPPPAPAPDASALLRPLHEQVAELEQRAIDAALKATAGNKLAAARLLGISRATLYERLRAPPA
ncbi:sigma-54 interaction domain-containing protein [Ottowia testudinis]|uniref:Sigma 54-interacting transcriptional regulator n=1 Tax=Ottowia testudinis TaxID=2816950 RepID=A0A975CL87_9BURK|nr:sigma 54-interacting transcriptional regulator [Ottowia testudinis]QTD46259.1 sigma 54-interacting transcriptional regulator [Ottowia testudinis]